MLTLCLSLALLATPSLPPQTNEVGLGAAFHAGRRAELRNRLGSGLILLRGLPGTRGYTEFRQDKVFWYLTGIESPGAALLMDASTGMEVLFLPDRNAAVESVEGDVWDAQDDWTPSASGIRLVKPSSELLSMLDELAEDRDVIWTSFHPHVAMGGCFDRAIPFDKAQLGDLLDGRPSRERALQAALEERYELRVEDLSQALHPMRLVKQEEELDALRRAGTAGALAMREAIRSTRPGVHERELDALLGFMQQLHGADGPAYHAIVGSGPNSITLHYSVSTRGTQDGDILLIDAGGELDHYTTDITRSWPVNGVFSERQAELYDAVLAAQEAGLAAARPGATLMSIDEAANKVLRERGFGAFIRHFTCHFLGLEVHDVGDMFAPLVPGAVLTVEPGLYEEATQIGIRIEDVIVITEDGHENLTRGVPVSRAEIEALIAEEGILDRRADGQP